MTGLTINFLGQAEVVEGEPTTDGLYAVEVYHGWKLLEWRKDTWWHPECVGPWYACEPSQWVGPLPPRRRQEFDL